MPLGAAARRLRLALEVRCERLVIGGGLGVLDGVREVLGVEGSASITAPSGLCVDYGPERPAVTAGPGRTPLRTGGVLP